MLGPATSSQIRSWPCSVSRSPPGAWWRRLPSSLVPKLFSPGDAETLRQPGSWRERMRGAGRTALMSCRTGTAPQYQGALGVGLRRERMLASRPDGPALCRQRRPVAGCAVPAQEKLPRPVHAVCRSDRGSAPITCLVHLLPPVVWLRDRKLAVVVSPQQCGEHGRFADLGLAGPGEQCQPPVLCKSAQV